LDAAWDMRAFVRVVEHQSFSAAANVLGLTPSAISKLVSRLEDRLGVRLLHRTTRRLALTSEGEVYFARARHILSDIDEAEAEVARSRGSPRGRLHVNTSIAFAVHQLAPALRTSSPAIRIFRWTCRSPTALSTWLRNMRT
jgi:DNA-binding transcriptional LysR family regulator